MGAMSPSANYDWSHSKPKFLEPGMIFSPEIQASDLLEGHLLVLSCNPLESRLRLNPGSFSKGQTFLMYRPALKQHQFQQMRDPQG